MAKVLLVVGAAVVIYDLLPLGISRVQGVLPLFVSRMMRLGVVRVGPQVQAVALTFDDGPDPKYTPRVLDVLRDAGVHATFFVLAEKARRHPDVIRRMIEEGHEVEVHGYTHACVPLLGPRKSWLQVAGSAEVLHQQFGIRAKFYRPTWGMINLIAWLATFRKNVQFVTWSIMVGDWRKTEVSVLMHRIMKRLHPGAIITLHDSDETAGPEDGAPESVISMLPDLVRSIRAQGYEFERLASWL